MNERTEESDALPDKAPPTESKFQERKSIYDVTLYTTPLVKANVTSLLEYKDKRQALIQRELEAAETEEKMLSEKDGQVVEISI